MTELDRDGDQPSIAHATPEAFRQALTARIASTANSESLHIPELHRQFAYSRFLYRVFASGDSECSDSRRPRNRHMGSR